MGDDTRQSWGQIVSQKRQARDLLLAPYLVHDVERRLPRVHQVGERTALDQETQRITDIDSVLVLLQSIEKGEFAAEQVVRAYIKRYEGGPDEAPRGRERESTY